MKRLYSGCWLVTCDDAGTEHASGWLLVEDGVVVAQSRSCNEAAAGLGWSGATPFLTLAFLALSVIPSLKLTDRGLVDVDRFEIVPLRV